MSIESETRRGASRSAIVLLVCGLAAGGAASAAFPWDVGLSDWLRGGNLPGDMRRMVSLSEAFAHGTGAAVILLAVYLGCGANKRRAVATAMAITVASGATANLAKMAFVRIRPHAAGHIRVVDSTTLQETEVDGGQEVDGEQSIEWVEADFWDSRQRSFPSGHSATAWGLAIGLCLAFPRASGVLIFVATLASVQRISSGAHYPSDVFAGAAIACVWATVILWIAGRKASSPDARGSA